MTKANQHSTHHPLHGTLTSNGPIEALNSTELLSELRYKVQYAKFKDDLLQKARTLELLVVKLREEDELLYMKALGTIAEIYDYYGRFEQARRLVSEQGEKVYAELLEGMRTKTEKGLEPRIQRQKIWLALHYAYTFYRDENYGEALKIGQTCEAVLGRVNSHDAVLFDSTLARVRFLLGQTWRHRNDYERSWHAYVEAIEYSFANFRRKTAQVQDDPIRTLEEQLSANRRVALCFLGLSSLLYTQGRLQNAWPFAIAARSLLFSTDDWLHKAYVELLFGCLQRSTAGFEKQKIEDAITTLRGPYSVFEKQKHDTYRARAGYELALAYAQAGRYSEAKSSIREVSKISQMIGNKRWQCYAKVVESRLYLKQKNPTKAKQCAQGALELAKRSDLSPQRLAAASIALGEAHIGLGEIVAARQEFVAAMKASQNHFQTRAICHLHLATTYIRQKNLRLADAHLDEYRKVEPKIESGVVHDLAKMVRAEIDSQKEDFLISSTEASLTYKRHVKRLRAYLVKQARQKYGSNEKIANVLGISRQTLYNWLLD
jgi:tetratricopeptide (TPR) repeat protein